LGFALAMNIYGVLVKNNMRTVVVLGSVLGIIVVVLAATLRAQEQYSGNYTVYGYGASSCGTWLRDAARSDKSFYELEQAWLAGFVSGVGYVNDRRLNKTDINGMKAYVDRYCADHPLDDIAKAAQTLVVALEAAH